MAGQVKFQIDADAAKAVAGFLKLVESQRKVDAGNKQIVASSKQTESSFESISKSITGVVAGFASFATVAMIVRNVAEEIMSADRALKEFWATAKGGGTLGDNIKDLPGFKAESARLSTTYATPTAEVNKLRERAGTIASDLKPSEQTALVERSLKHRLAAGEDPSAVLETIDAIGDVYPDMTLRESSNMVEFLRQRGGMSVAEQKETLPSLLPSMGHLNIPGEDLAAIVATGTRSGGANSDIARSVKTTLSKIPGLVEQGKLQQSESLLGYFEQLEKISQESPAEFEEMVGRRAIPGISFITRNQEMYKQFRTEAGQQKGDTIEGLLTQLNANPEVKRSLDSAKIDEGLKNAMLEVPEAQQKFIADARTREVGFTRNLPLWLKWLGKPFAWGESIRGGDTVASIEGQKAIAGIDESRKGGISFQAPRSLAELRMEEKEYQGRIGPLHLSRDAHMNRPMQRTKTIFTGTSDPEQAQAFVDSYFKASGMKNAPQLAEVRKGFDVATDTARTVLGLTNKSAGSASGSRASDLLRAAADALDVERKARDERAMPKTLHGNPVNSPQ